MSIAKQVATGKVPVVSSRRTSNKAKMPLKMATYIAARSLVTKKDEKKTADEGGRFLYNIYLLKEQLFKQRVLHISLSLSRFYMFCSMKQMDALVQHFNVRISSFSVCSTRILKLLRMRYQQYV